LQGSSFKNHISVTAIAMVALQQDALGHDAPDLDALVDGLQAHILVLMNENFAMGMQMRHLRHEKTQLQHEKMQLHNENLCLKSCMADRKSSDVSTEFGDEEMPLQSSLSDVSDAEIEIIEVIDSDDEAVDVPLLPSMSQCESITACASSVDGRTSTKVQWRIHNFSEAMNKKRGRGLVSPEVCVGELNGVKLTVAPELKDSQVSKSERSLQWFKKLVTEGPFHGCIILKVPNAPKSPMSYYVSINNRTKGPFTSNFSDQCSVTLSGLGVDWLPEKDTDGSILVGVEIILPVGGV